jgi:hypothetical protein
MLHPIPSPIIIHPHHTIPPPLASPACFVQRSQKPSRRGHFKRTCFRHKLSIILPTHHAFISPEFNFLYGAILKDNALDAKANPNFAMWAWGMRRSTRGASKGFWKGAEAMPLTPSSF